MKRPGAIYKGSEGREYLAVYNYEWDVSTLLPREYRKLKQIAAVTYTMGRKKGGVDIFALSGDIPPIEEVVRIKKEFSREERGFKRASLLDGTEIFDISENVDTLYDIKSQVVSSLDSLVKEEILGMVRADIYDHCGEKTAVNKRDGPALKIVPRIIPVTEIEKVNPERMLTPGKAEFVPQCILEANIDYTKGCLTSWIPGPDASFDGRFFTDYFQFIWGDCEYCYAMRNHRSFPKTIYEFDQSRLLEELKGGARLTFGSDEPLGKPVEILRFGKRTEPWTPFTENDFLGTLEAMTQTGTRGVITTKFLPYDQKFVDLLRKTKSTVLFSTGGSEDVELGPLEWGRTNEFRIDQARQYREAKVNAALFYLMNPIFAPTKDDLRRLESAEKNRIPVQFIPARFYSTNREAVQKMIAPLAEMSDAKIPMWNFLKDSSPGQIDFVGTNQFANSYELIQGVLMPKLDRIHPFWADRIRKNTGGQFRMCAHDGKTTYCGGCFAKAGVISPTGQDREGNELVKITRGSLKNRDRKRIRTDKPKPDRNQLPIFGKKQG